MRAVTMRGVCLTALCGLLAACSGGGSGRAAAGDASLGVAGAGNVVVTWAANREAAVNRPGGGYRIYHAPSSDFLLEEAAGVIDVPYGSGAAAPTATMIALPAGTHYLRLVAYSTINPSGSEPSAAVAVVVP